MKKTLFHKSCLVTLVLLLGCILAGCAKKENIAYQGSLYQQTEKVSVAFLPEQVAKDCYVFAHLLITIPANKNGAEIAKIVLTEAKLRGADTVLLGQGRESEEDADLEIRYYGPSREYLCSDKWCGWKYGYDIWEQQGNWIGVGYQEWNNKTKQYAQSIMLQVAFLRCR